MSTETKERKVDIAGILNGFSFNPRGEESAEQVNQENQQAHKRSAENLVKLTNEIVALVKKLAAESSESVRGALEKETIDKINKLSDGSRQASTGWTHACNAANELQDKIGELEDELAATKQERNLATLLVGIKAIQEVSENDELMEGLQIG